MARARFKAGPRERLAGYGVLAVLAALAVWLLTVQARYNPAVIVALTQPAPKGAVQATSPARAFATAAFLEDLKDAQAAGAVESFDPETLSDKIDGKAELYLASHFEAMSCRAFAGAGGTRLEASLYAMATPKDAFAVASAQRRAGAEASALTPGAMLAQNALTFTKGRFYAEIIADRTGNQASAALEALGAALHAALPAEAEAASEAELFPKNGLAADSVRLAVSDAMGMEGLGNVYTADYDLPAGPAGAFLAVREAEAAATADAAAYITFLKQNGYKDQPAEGLPAGTVLLAMEGSFEVVMIRGKTFAGVHDATTRDAALALAKELDASLKAGAP